VSTEPTSTDPTLAEEIVHAATHGAGAVLSLGALVVLVTGAAVRGTTTAIVSASVFGASLVLVYLASTIYHALPARLTRAKALFQIFDHAAIHLLIAGTATPVALSAIGGTWGWVLFGVAWTLAAIGIVVETTPLRRHARLSIALYLGSGWTGAAAIPLLFHSAPVALVLLAVGGVAYTLGVPFFLAERRRWMHALWHGFVMAGSAFHVLAVGSFLV
jgi:hemolysin III